MQNAHALPHFLHPHQVAVVAIADRADGHVELQLVVDQIRMGFAQIVFHSAAAQIGAGDAVIDGYLPGENANITSAINKDTVACQELFRFVEVDVDFLQKFAALLDPARRQIA